MEVRRGSLPPKFIAPVLLALFFIQGLFLIPATSPTADEVAFHAVNGYVFLKTGDYRMSPANPALIREWTALPWLLLDPVIDLKDPNWAAAESVPFCLKFFYQDNRAIAAALLYSARFMVLILGVLLGWLIFTWSKRLYGVWGGVLSLALYSFCPTFLAYSAIASIDLGPAFFSTLACFCLWRYLEKETARNFWLLALCLALAFAAKYSILFLLPLFLGILWVKKGPRVFIKAAGAFALMTFLVIWASYSFEFKPLLAGNVPRIEEKMGFITAADRIFHVNIAAWLQKLSMEFSIPAPSYLLGVAGIVRNHRLGFLHYLNGRWSSDWHWYYYFISFAVKMTIPFLIFLTLRIFFWRRSSSGSKHEKVVLLVPVLTMFALVCFDRFAQGIRYLFPVLPLLHVWIGGLARPAIGSVRWRWALGVILAAHIVASVSVYPNSLSFFNSFAGGSKHAYRFIRGTDLDWGQGLPALADHQKKNKLPKLRLLYFGAADPSFYGILYEELPEDEKRSPAKQVYAISLYSLGMTRWADAAKPDAIVGGSIAIYDFR